MSHPNLARETSPARERVWLWSGLILLGLHLARRVLAPNLWPDVGLWGGVALNVGSAVLIGGVLALGISWLSRPAGNTTPDGPPGS
jgi:hypothetical protein